MARARTARTDRRVGIRPAPDTMAVLSGFVPAEQGIAAWANLDRHARALKAAGDPRSLGQLMADTLIERLTGQATAAAVPVEIGITMTADSLLGPGTDQTPANLDGCGPTPADLALNLAAQAAPDPSQADPHPADPHPADPHPADPDPADPAAARASQAAQTAQAAQVEVRTAVWVRRLFTDLTDPLDDTITHVDTRRRRFDAGLARLIGYRDQTCRDPHCTATIRHLDHIHPHRDHGPTTAANGAGLCERGNYAKDLPGWTRTVATQPDDTHRIQIRTPTGHHYTTTPPPHHQHSARQATTPNAPAAPPYADSNSSNANASSPHLPSPGTPKPEPP